MRSTKPDRAVAGAVDTHTHFYDPARPEGVPWPRPDEAVLHRTVLPSHFREQAEPLGIAATVVVEASAWLADNDWVLDLAEREPCIAGFVGHLEPGEELAGQLRRLTARPRFRGLRLSGEHLRPGAVAATTRAADELARAGLTLDLLIGGEELGEAAELAARFPELSVVIDHLGGVRIDGGNPPAQWLDRMAKLAACPGVSCKASGYVEAADRRPGPTDPGYYRPVLDAALGLFGAQRIVWGSNWPVCELGGSYATVVNVARAFAGAQAAGLEELLFRDNAVRAYGLALPGVGGRLWS
jgi:L-fuconolactonase